MKTGRRGIGDIRLKGSVYALEDPSIPGLYIRLGGEAPRLTPRAQATLAPAAPEYRAALCARASIQMSGQPHELVRLDA